MDGGLKLVVGLGRMEGTSVLGDDVQVRDELYVNGAIVIPNKSISHNITSWSSNYHVNNIINESISIGIIL